MAMGQPFTRLVLSSLPAHQSYNIKAILFNIRLLSIFSTKLSYIPLLWEVSNRALSSLTATAQLSFTAESHCFYGPPCPVTKAVIGSCNPAADWLISQCNSSQQHTRPSQLSRLQSLYYHTIAFTLPVQHTIELTTTIE